MNKHRTRTTGWDRLLSGVLCLALVLGLLPAAGLIQPAEAAETEHWAYPYAEQLIEWGVMSELRLDDEINRAEFVAMCNRAFGYKQLGGVTFIDVPSSAWYAQDMDIGYTAGYFKGTSTDPAYLKASPNDPLTREQAAVMVARNLRLQETVGESLGFTDSRELQEWSSGLIGAAVAEGMIGGYTDGSFRPANNITRGEVAKMLVSVIGTPIDTEGSYTLGNVYGNVTISSSKVTLRNTVILGNLYVTGGVDLGNVLLENVTVLGRIVISGGGESDAAKSSVILRNVEADELMVDSMVDQFVTISAYGFTDIPVTSVRSDTWLEDASEAGYGLQYIEFDAAPGTKLQLAGAIKEVLNKTPLSNLQLVKGTAQEITIDEYAKGSTVLVADGTLVYKMNLDVATTVTGKGDIKELNVSAAGCEVDILPEEVNIRPGLSATVDGEEIGTVEAAELSSEPRLQAGYPNVTNIAPTQAQVQFAVNKPGTIYWAVSELTSGSVDPEDLIHNPVYGGNIFANQAGSLSADAKNVYVQQITGLVPGGSYYLSAIMVDGRGVQSPLKVVSFTTPDNTVPAFVGDPYMSKETCEIAQVTATANKDCVMYWALLTEGAAPPTPQEFRSGSVGGSYGYGSTSVVKNVPISVKVNRYLLPEDTTFWLYLWLTDENGVQSMAAPLRLEVHTPDETAPIVPAPFQSAYGESTAGVTFSINEAPATLYWAVVAEGDETFISSSADMTNLRTKMKVENGTGAIAFSGPTGVAAAGANVDTLFTITGLDTDKTGTNNYIMYYVAKDAAGNYSERVGYIHIRTLDTDYPTVEQEFTSVANNNQEQPLADTSIRLVFSEQVKGGSVPSTEISGNTPVTFLDFYNQVLAAGNDQMRQEAKNRLAKELDAHIKLYYWPETGSPYALTPRGDQAGDDDNWVIDWHNAVITQDAEGRVIITLNSIGADPALQLDSGATYNFQFLDVFDNAYKPNGLEGDRLGNYTMQRFTTVYAQVDFWQNTGVSKITGSKGGAFDDIRLDIVVDISPRSTKKVPLSEFWDLIMWGDNEMTVDIYRQVVEKDNESNVIEGWHQVRSGVIFTYAGSGKGLKEDELTENFEPVNGSEAGGNKGLKEGYIYRYGIHIKTLEGTPEDDPAGIKEPQSWGARATMRFSLIAGSSGNVADVSRLVNQRTKPDENYNDYLKRGAIKEIGTWNSPEDGPVNILRGTHQFRDSRAPSFMSIYPQFIPGSGSITMQVMLDRPGTVYYVVAPVGELGTSVDGNTMIGLTNDGRDITENQWSDPSFLAGYFRNGKTYIPTGGNDITNTTRNYIQFVSGGETDEEKMYKAPQYLRQVYNVGEALPVPSADKRVEVTIPNLTPEQEYYVYIVLEGGGDPSPVMQIYRVDTTASTPPVITMSSGSTDATMTALDKDNGNRVNAEITYGLVEWNSLPTFFTERTYTWSNGSQNYGSGTILWAMITRTAGPNSKTVFDECVDTAVSSNGGSAADYKKAAMDYLTTAGENYEVNLRPIKTWTVLYDPNRSEYASGVYQNFAGNPSYLPENTSSECVVLAVARIANAGTGVENCGFAAARGLYRPDPDPPAFAPEKSAPYRNGTYYLTISSLMAYDNRACTGREVDWRSVPPSNPTRLTSLYYKGKITISFDKPVYQYDGNVKRAVCTTPSLRGNPTDTQIHILDALNISSSAVLEVEHNRDGAQQNFTISFTGMYYSDTITFLHGEIANSSPQGGTTQKQLTLRFDPLLTMKDYNPDSYIEMWVGGFVATWG